MSLKAINGRLTEKPYVEGYFPSKEDAKTLQQLVGSNTNVLQWAARMASYYSSERAAIPNCVVVEPKKEAPKATPPVKKSEDEDDIDLFGEETEEEKAALDAKRKADEDKKKAKKVVIAKSSILVDIKPWDDTTDLLELAKKLHAVEKDGLIWGAHKLIPIAFGVKKLQQLLVIEDDKVSGEDLEDIIMGFEDDVQSMDIVAWNKV